MVVSETRSGVESDYIGDPLGSTIGLMNSAGTMTDRWEYWPYGEVVSRTGTNATPLTFLGVIGYFQDILSKLFYVRARHLRVDLARWLTVDPLWPGQAAYTYVANMPAGKADPSGLIVCPSLTCLIQDQICAAAATTAYVACAVGAIQAAEWLGPYVLKACLLLSENPVLFVISILTLLLILLLIFGFVVDACTTAFFAWLKSCQIAFCACCISFGYRCSQQSWNP